MGLLALGVVLQRRAFLVFGAIGLFLYLGHLAWEVFKDAILFTLALSAPGFALIALAVRSQRRTLLLSELQQRWVPQALMRWVPPRR